MNTTVAGKLANFFGGFPSRHYKKGESVIWANEAPLGVIFLESGNVGQYDISDSGQKIILNIFKPGAFFPMSWVLNQTNNRYFYEALTTVECRIAPPDKVVEILHNNPDITLDLLSRVYKGTDGLLIRLAELMTGTARSQLLLEILISTYRFGVVNKDGSAQLNIKTTELAQRTGMARETIGRELKKLEDNNIIVRKKGLIIIKDLGRFGQI